MRRVVIDPDVIISGLLSPAGPPGQVLAAVRAGEVEIVVSSSTSSGAQELAPL